MPDLPPEIEPTVLEVRVKEAKPAARAAIEHLYAKDTRPTMCSPRTARRSEPSTAPTPTRRGRSPTATPSAKPSKPTPTTPSTPTPPSWRQPGTRQPLPGIERVTAHRNKPRPGERSAAA